MLAGILAGAMGGGAQAAVDIADGELAQRRKTEMMQLEQQLAIERADAIARRQQALDRDQLLWKTQGAGAAAQLDYEKRKGAVDTEVEAAKRKALDPLDVTKAGDMEGARQTAATNATKARGGDKDYLRAKQAEADASESGSLKASRGESTRGSRLENDEKEFARKERARAEELRNRGDEAGAKKIEDALARRQGAKAGQEYDVEKVTEVTEDPATGNKTTRERTERRKPGAAAPAAPGRLTPGAVVDGYRFLGGNPNDKNSWAPAAQSGAGSVK